MSLKIELDIIAEFFKSGVKLKGGDYLKRGELNVSENLFEEIRVFSMKSTRIYGMGNISKKANWDYLFNVDINGYALKEKLTESLPNSSVRYFSPGLDKFLVSVPKIESYKKRLNIIDHISRIMFRNLSKDDWDEFSNDEK